MLWTTDEETGSATSRALLETEARAERSGPRVGTRAARRRPQDPPQRMRRVRGGGARRGCACGSRSRQGGQRDWRACPSDSGDRDAAGPRARRFRQRRRGRAAARARTSWRSRHARGSTRARRRGRRRSDRCGDARADAAPQAPRSRSRRVRPAADGAHARRRAPVRAWRARPGTRLGRKSTKEAPAAVRTAISVRRSAFPRSTGWARSATALTRCTSTSSFRSWCRARRCLPLSLARDRCHG